jgi:3-oxoacyl-[acyl-carrier-protein] synthase-1
MKRRVVITGMGVVAPNGVGLPAFTTAIRAGQSGIRYWEELADLKFSCCIAGAPEVPEDLKTQYLTPLQLRNFVSSGILYGCMAGIDAWEDAGLGPRKNKRGLREWHRLWHWQFRCRQDARSCLPGRWRTGEAPG